MPDEEKKKKFTEDFVDKWSQTNGSAPKKADPEAELKKLRDLIKQDTKNPDNWNNMGMLLAKMGKYKEALGCFDRVIELDPAYDGVWNSKADIGHF